ncbi:MAG: response regulator [Nitrospirae bacterium]|nr:response regulator [Nitrospirota bacterium]
MESPTRSIMLVDKSTTLRYYHGMLLTRLRYAILTAASPEEAMMILEHTIPSCVLSGYLFPMMSGSDFIKKLKSLERTRNVPVIVLTGEKDAAARKTCMDLGCASFLTKPVEPVRLYREIQAATESMPRSNIRLETSLKAVVGDVDRAAQATMISEGGLYLNTTVLRPKDAITPVRIFIKDREIKATAVVLYSHTRGSGVRREAGMGLKFLEISDEDRKFLRNFIEEQLTSDIMPDDAR